MCQILFWVLCNSRKQNTLPLRLSTNKQVKYSMSDGISVREKKRQRRLRSERVGELSQIGWSGKASVPR